MNLPDRILDSLDHATPQQPMRHAELVTHITRARPETTPDEISDHLEAMIDARQVGTCRITRNGISQNVYWPTGRKTPALAGIKPKEPLTVPTNPANTATSQEKPDTQASRLIKAIVAHGPIMAADLAEMIGSKVNSIDGSLLSAIKAGTITTRMAFVTELGRERKHYMTRTQAEEWDEPSTGVTPELPEPATQGHAMSHPSVHAEVPNPTENPTEQDALRVEIHQLKNDLAARNLILYTLAETLQVEAIEDIPTALDELLGALNARALSLGKPALLLIDSDELTELEPLPEDMNAREMRQEAERAIHQGHAARAVIVRVIAEARRQVEWKEAA